MGCDRHPYDRATGRCRVCAAPFCPECLVWDGEDHPPACIPCALASRLGGRPARRSRLLARA